MKAKVLKFLQNLPVNPIEQFNAAFKLYQQCPGNQFSQIRYLNAAGYTKYNLENILYDIQQVCAITDAEIRAAKPRKFPAVNPYAVPAFAKGAPGNLARQKFVKQKGIEVTGKTNKVMDPAIKNWSEEMTAKAAQEKATKEQADKDAIDNIDVDGAETISGDSSKSEVFKDAPDEVKDYISLHEEFPFLGEDDCPEELKILVSDKRKHYNRYVEANKELLVVATDDGSPAAMTNEQIYDIAVQAVENWEANQAIYAELDHYKKEGKILGEHVIFVKRQLKEKIDSMTMADAAKRQSNLDNYIRRDSKALENAMKLDEGTRDVDEINKLEKKIEGWKIEQGLVLAKLGSSEK